MRRAVLLFAVALLCASVAWAQTGKVVKIIKPTKMDVSAPLSEMVKKSQARAELRGQEREIPNLFSSGGKRSSKSGRELNTPDPLLQQQPVIGTEAVTIGLNFAGGSNTDNLNVLGFRVAPPDPNMDVGPNHIVQTINLVTTIWNKSGAVLMGPFATNDLWNGFGGPCEINNDGDPVVLYDHLADRWVISQFVFGSDECVCVSTGSDPTGSYNRYQFSTPGNDYPKLGVMADAYYATFRNFDGAFNMDAAAMDRAKMLAGDPSATIQIFNLSALNPDVEGFIPADLDGPAPPSGTPGFIVGHNGGPSLVHNELEVYKLDVDFATPGNSSLSLASAVTVAQFDLTVSTVPQPRPGSSLDALAYFTMHRATIRDFGSGQNFRMALTHTVDANGSNLAGVRWYEIRDNTRTGNSWTLHQQGTFAPDATHRWMPSIAMNANGDIGLSYTVSSRSVYPSIRATGRAAADPLGTLQPEVTIVAGTGSQTQTGRWGDYASLSVDPSNNTTFIGTHEYVINTGSFNWWTRVFSFNVTGSGGGGCNNIAQGKDASASSTQGNNLPSKAVDGNTSTFWRSGSGGTQWLQVDLGSGALSYSNGEIVWNSDRHATSYEVRVSNDPSFGSFATVFTTTSGDGGTDGVAFTGAPRNERYIRLHMTVPNNGHYRVAEFRVCGGTAAPSISKDALQETALTANVPEQFQLHQNYPNPFNPSTRIRFDLPQATDVKLTIFNTLGEEVRTLLKQYHEAGSYEVEWDGRLSSGTRAPSGVYIYRLEGEGLKLVKKMTLLQ
jgi:hypothetical protein